MAWCLKVYCTFVHLQVIPLVEAVECVCCSKVFFGLRNYSEEAENTAWKPRAGIYLFSPLKFKRCAELDGAARLRLTLALISSVRPNRYSTEERHSQVKNEARCKTTHLKSWCEKHITKPIARFFLFEQREGFVEGDGLRDVESAISGAT